MKKNNVKKAKGKIKFSDEFDLSQPEKRTAFPMFLRDWQRLRRTAIQIKSPNSFWQIAWPAMFGIAFTWYAAALTILANHPNKTLCYALAIGFLIGGFFSFILDKNQKELTTFTKGQLLVEMDEIEGQCQTKPKVAKK